MLIEVNDLVKRFGRQTALGGVSLRLEPGQIMGFAGPNGAGKTTTLRILMGFLEPQAGSVRVLGQDPLLRRRLDEIGWMPERPAFPPRLRVGRLIEFQAASFPSWDYDLATSLTERLGIDRASRADRLSRGQAARLALLFALAHRPRLLLLDDPTLGLDPSGRRLLLGELLASVAEAGTGILISTHLLAEADWSLDRLVILHHGKVLLDEPVESLKARCRRVLLPPKAAGLPAELAPIRAAGAVFSSRWDEDAWQRFQAEVPGARTEAANVEDIYVALTGD